jgi:quercetin dioxygenase-like cupin family protein
MATQRKPPLVRRLLALAALAFIVALPLGTATAQAPRQTTFLNVRFPGVPTPGSRFDLVQSVIDLNPGGSFTVESTTAPHYLGVARGGLTIDLDGVAQDLATGKAIAAPAGSRLTVSNAAGGAVARLFVSSLLEPGAIAAAHQPSAAGVVVMNTSRITMSGLPQAVDLVLLGFSYDPGYFSPDHIMLQPHLQTITGGECTYRYYDTGLVEVHRPFVGIEMYVRRPGTMGTTSSAGCEAIMTWVATPGQPLTKAAPATTAPAPPNTGTGPAQAAPGVPAALAATGLILVVLGASAFAAVGSRRTPQAS